MREPLSGWTKRRYGPGMTLAVGVADLIAHIDEWYAEVEMLYGYESELAAAQLAAEDAARAMVADMATALGGSVTWATEGGG